MRARLNLSLDLGDESVGPDKIFFHQPYSHFCCLMYAFRNFRSRARLYCVLHEASNYNVGVARYPRALLGTFFRIIVIWLCLLLGVKVLGVSRFVCSTYGLPARTISYLYLFKNVLDQKNSDSIDRKDAAVVWLRRGDAERSALIISRLANVVGLAEIAVLGDVSECDLFRKVLESVLSGKQVKIINDEYKVSEQRFLQLLQSSKWFVSTYPREGFGLSAFQAVYFGCIVLARRSGALAEWLPVENYAIAAKVMNGTVVAAEEIEAASTMNTKFAMDYIAYEN